MRLVIDEMAAQAGLSRFEWMVMSNLLYARRHAEPATIEQLTNRVDLTREQIEAILDVLIRRGWASRSGSQPTVWALTRSGERLIQPTLKFAESLLVEATSELGTGERDALRDALHKMVRNSRDLGR